MHALCRTGFYTGGKVNEFASETKTGCANKRKLVYVEDVLQGVGSCIGEVGGI